MLLNQLKKKYMLLSLFNNQYIKVSIFDLKNIIEEVVRALINIKIIDKRNITFLNVKPIKVYIHSFCPCKEKQSPIVPRKT